MKTGFLILAFLLLITACAKRPYGRDIQYAQDGTTIYYHDGGNTRKVHTEIIGYKKPIKIFGECHSSCTYVFKYKNTCVYPNARILFHAFWNADRTINYHETIRYLNTLPKNLRSWLLPRMFPQGKHTKIRNDIVVSGSGMHRLFSTPLC